MNLRIHFEGHVGVIADGTPDPEVLKLTTDNGRVPVSADVRTMLVNFAEFITHTEIARNRSHSFVALFFVSHWGALAGVAGMDAGSAAESGVVARSAGAE